ncbi:predicted protein [Sclerotinia sclerotiorum 1980 UF-70]|uniref:Uncharacterized protein n=1 Tax=Sclerotinia sclerotiorum (strain ATCC 18683 / 1980 / Ss-1) TaxID=665079 RepID=A7EX75_SCLS1|nr:predicted protein [Sclerotinia sclerotiorum 1980 UF-70]EDN94067.1 predicted protein [Sclerotinia sclerotiorum 1980 UF-70]
MYLPAEKPTIRTQNASSSRKMGVLAFCVCVASVMLIIPHITSHNISSEIFQAVNITSKQSKQVNILILRLWGRIVEFVFEA